MLIRVFLAAVFGLLIFAPAGATATVKSGLPLAVSSNLILAQTDEAKTEAEDEEDEDPARRDRGRAKAKEKADDADRAKQRARDEEDKSGRERLRAKAEAEAKAKAKEAAETQAKSEAEAKAKQAAEARAKAKAKAEAEAKAKEAAEARRKAKAEAELKEDADRQRAKTKQQKIQETTKAAPEPKAAESVDSPKEAKGETSGDRRTGDADRDDRRRAREKEQTSRREDTRVRERAKAREKESTTQQQITTLKVEEGKPVEIDRGARVLRIERGRTVVRSDDLRRLRSDRDRLQVERLPGGLTQTTIIRPDGTRIITITDARGEIVRRWRRDPRGREFVLIEDVRRPPLLRIDLGPLRITIPQQYYIVDARRATRSDYERALRARPVEPLTRAYSLYEIRNFERVRAIMPRIDFNIVTFATNSAYISPEQFDLLADIADVMLDMIDENPNEMFMAAGHTDATGPRDYNLVLADRRAASVAFVLTDYFGVPPENLVPQGYGPDYPRIPTLRAEPLNRRVEFLRLTPLLAGR